MSTEKERKDMAMLVVMKRLEELHKEFRGPNGNDLLIGGLDSYVYTEKLAALAQTKNFIAYGSFSISDETMIDEVRRHLEDNRMVIVAAWGKEERADLYLEPNQQRAERVNVAQRVVPVSGPEERVGGPVSGHYGKLWKDFSESFLKTEVLCGVFELVTEKGEGALGCVRCRGVTRLGPCSNCGGINYSLAGSLDGAFRLFCVRCQQGFRSWPCRICGCENPVNTITLLSRVNERSSMCFIATAAYGDSNSPAVIYLSAFRDEFLKRSRFGRKLVEAYYVTSPPLALLISKVSFLQAVVRTIILKPLVLLLRKLW